MKLKLLFLLTISFSIFSCDKLLLETNPETSDKIIQTEFYIDLPSSISHIDNNKNISGNEISLYTRNFIFYADDMSRIVEKSYNRISSFQKTGLMDFSYTGVDEKTKHVAIVKNYSFENKIWDYFMEVSNNNYSDIALQSYWNINNNEQIIIFKPNTLNNNELIESPNAMVRIEYNYSINSTEYEKTYFVGISNLNISENFQYIPDNINLFVGEKLGIYDIIASSNNPNANLFNQNTFVQRNWTIAAKVDNNQNIAFVNIAIPINSLTDITDIWENYSVKNVFYDELLNIYTEYSALSQEDFFNELDIDINSLNSQIYFNSEGIYYTGTNIPNEYSHLVNISELEPFTPFEIKNYTVEFE
ncbi:MAG: hypothetical protein JXR51_06020 [Bacteroidales bacterium]|nr:hypothetical protein [Bacteroidales bacterium]MBN2756717.1 hypothetical protein [Bacteroidales bacterium]